ncbi:T9SS type A sorting domain-containing protein, partial [Crocinitomicaceae bacterium]|nr:T9SS type A sorting domain-containing protein [Crocinitomicaceae bacterium]
IMVIGTLAGCSATSSDIVMEVFTAPTTTLSNDDVGGDNIICGGTSVTFSSTGATTYEFFVDGTSVQGPSATSTFTTSTLLNGQVVTVDGISNTCLVSQSQTFTVLINPVVDLFSSDIDNIICEGDPIVFTGANASTYEFFIDGTSVQGPSTDFTLVNPTITSGAHVITVTGTAGNGCTDTGTPINLTVNPIPTITATSSDANNIICAGESVTFTGSGGSMYQFFINGTPQGSLSTANTFVTNSLLDGQTLTINGSSLGCLSTSNAVVTTVNPVPSVALNSTDVDNVYCDGEVVDYTATGADDYEFLVNTVSQGAPSPLNTINSTGFGTGSIVLEVIGEVNGCFDTTSANITINPLPTGGLTSSEPTNSICAGESVTYTATGGVLYEFFINGTSQGTLSPNDAYTTNALADNDVVSVVASASTGCTDTVVFAPITVSPFPTMTLVSTDTTICNGQLVDFTATGATDYEFFINSVSQGIPSPTNTLSSSGLNNGDVVTVEGTSLGCTANSSNIVFVVYGFPIVDLLNNGDNQICVGENADLEASGASNYEFFVNGTSQGVPSPGNTFNGVLNNGDVVTVEGETNGCVSPGNNSVSFTVLNFPTLNTSTSTGTTVCLGDTVTVTGSGAMTYEFQVNGTLVQQGASANFISSDLEDGDQVTVIGYNGDCPSTPDVISFTVNTMILDLDVAPDAFICEGENATFTASGADEYLFFLNGVAQGTQGPTNTFASSTLADQDEVTFIGYNNTTLCEQPLNDFIIMNVIDAPTISGTPTTFCEGDSVVLLSNLPYGNQWVLDGTPIPGATDTSYVATVGGDYSLDVTSGGQGDLWSVGQNATGIFGDASNFNAVDPTAANANLIFDEITSGFAFMLGVSETGELYAWGENSSGQLGDGTYTSSNVPQQVPTLTNVKTSAATENSSVAVTDAGDLYVWGNNSQGQLGTGNSAVINFPFLNPNINNIDSVAGGRDHYVFLRNNGTVWTVGDNSAGQLGQGFISDSILSPVQVGGLANIVAVGAGEYHSFAISNTNELYVWGNNGSGQLGLGDLNNRLVPTLASLDNVVAAQGGAAHSIFLTSDNEVYTSGSNSFGQLGTGTTSDTLNPVLVDVPSAVSISAGQYTSLVLRSDASVFAFGNNVEQQLSTLPTSVTSPSHLTSLDGVTYIEASAFSSHFLYGTEQECASAAVTVTVNPTPVVTISENNGVLTAVPAVAGATYQWYLNGNPIVAPNPTDPSITITAGGEYSVEVTSADGCIGTAAYTSTLDIEDLTTSDVYLFPNPAQDIINVNLGATKSTTQIVVTDQTGRIVIAETISGNQTILDIKDLATGVYNVTLTGEDQQNTLRFVKSQQ